MKAASVLNGENHSDRPLWIAEIVILSFSVVLSRQKISCPIAKLKCVAWVFFSAHRLYYVCTMSVLCLYYVCTIAKLNTGEITLVAIHDIPAITSVLSRASVKTVDLQPQTWEVSRGKNVVQT